MGVSERALRPALASVALAGLGVSGYLTYERAVGASPACVIGSGCTTVQESEYAELAGVPVAWLGLAAYAAFLLAALLPGEAGRVLGLFTALVGFAFSAYLTAVELWVIDAICAWCVASAILVTLALAIAVARVAGARGVGEDAISPRAPRAAPPSPGRTARR